MGLFYTATQKETLNARNELFLSKGVPALKKNGFEKSPFSTDWFGRNNLQDFTYTLCRLNAYSHLEIINTHISRGDKFVKVFLNVFDLTPALNSLHQLDGLDGIQYALPPNSINNMRLRSDEYTGLRLFRTRHKLNRYYTERGFKNSVYQLGELIEKDMGNIDHFVHLWYKLRTPIKTDWNGNEVVKTADSVLK
ncbi:MAG: hypothetical protein JKY70_15930 [Mucilaginibacter sp.]|nr:hypothetical protein [Mucilaginibacter sp.]